MRVGEMLVVWEAQVGTSTTTNHKGKDSAKNLSFPMKPKGLDALFSREFGWLVSTTARTRLTFMHLSVRIHA
jgi:hypothetical protein